MTPEIVARVDAWVADHRPALLVRGRWLVNDWRKACTLWRYRRAKDPGDASGAVASAQAAMHGVLLELVRWAWNDPRTSVTPERGRPGGEWACCVQPPARQVGRMFVAGSEDESLVVALEAAPRREAS